MEQTPKQVMNLAAFNCPMSVADGHPSEAVWRQSELALDQQSCSWCGSLHPDALMEGLEKGTILLGATDKTYKVYVDAHNAPKLGSIKFYWYHLSEAQRLRFIELLNEQKLRFSSGTGFYVLPFFCARKQPGSV